MRKILSIVLILFAFTGVTQTTKIQTVESKQASMTKAELSQVRNITEIFTELPKDYKSMTISMVGKCHGRLLTAQWTGEELNQDALGIFKNADKASKLYIDVKVFGKKSTTLSKSIVVE